MHRSLQLVVATAVMCGSAPAWGGSFVNMDTQLPNAGNAAVAGAGGTTRQGPEAASQNPAAMASLDESWVGLSGGTGGLNAAGTSDATLVWPLEDDLTVGLGSDSFYGKGPAVYLETTTSLSASLAPVPSVSLGLRLLEQVAAQKGGTVNGGQDTAVDAGLRWSVFDGRRQALALGWWGSQLASSWPNRYWYAAVPVTERLGAEWTFKRALDLDVQFEDPQYASTTVSQQVWRLGATYLGFKSLQPSIGAAFSAADTLPLVSAGVTAPFRVWGVDGRVTYAFTVQDAGMDQRHRVALELGLPSFRRPGLVVVPLSVVYEPGTHKVKSATISLAFQGDTQTAQSWELEVRDPSSGRLLRTLRGNGVPPALVTWDGKDALGLAISNADQVSYRLKLKTTTGDQLSKEAFNLDATVAKSGLEMLATGPQQQVLVVPVLDKDGKVVQLSLRPPKVPPVTLRWEILIQSSDNQTLHRLSGTGPFPTEVTWDGTDASGRRLLDQPGLKVRFNAYDTEGRLNSVEQALDSGLQPIQEKEAPLPRLGLRIPAFREGGPQLAMFLSDRSLERLVQEGEARPTPEPGLGLSPAPSPGATPPTEQAVASATPTPTAVAVAEAGNLTATVTEAPTPAMVVIHLHMPSPTPRPTPSPTNSPSPTAIPSPAPVEAPTPVPTPLAAEPHALASGLSTAGFMPDLEKLPPAIMTRSQAEALGGRRRSPGTVFYGHPTRLPSSIDGVLDVFKPDSAEVDEAAYADKLQAFYWRLTAYKNRRIQLTGLVGNSEDGGEELSRQRVREFSQRMVEEGGFEGEFILKVDGRPGKRKGVLVEVLSR